MTIERIRATISPILESYGVLKADLFGSFARSEQTPESDIDLIIDRGPVTGLKFFALQNELSDALGRKVDLQPLDGASEAFLTQISEDRITLYVSQ